MIIRGGLSGLAGGLALGFFLKWIQTITGLKVYTLLLNIDFIYPKPLDEWVEFGLHLAVAVFIGIGYIYTARRLRITGYFNQTVLVLIIILPAVLLYFPLSILAVKEVAEISDMVSFGWWCAGHFIFTVVAVGVGYKGVYSK